jgi:DNA invertase Pin-like site-specific DNA recombinase
MTATLTLERARLLVLPPGATCVGYVRVSTARQGEEGDGRNVTLETQVAACEALAARYGRTLDHVVRHVGRHGDDLARLDELVAACSAHRLPPGTRGLVVCFDTDRWGRFERAGQDRMFRELLHRVGWDIRIADEPEDEDANLWASQGKALAGGSWLKGHKKRIREMMARVARCGYWLGRAPWGYRIVAQTTGAYASAKAPRARLSVDPDAAPVVKRIFKFFVGGSSFQEIAAELERDDVPGPFDTHQTRRHSRRCWTPGTVRTILRNGAYRGEVTWKQRHVHGVAAVPARGHVPEAQWVRATERQPWWHDATHPHAPLVDERTWAAAQARLRATRPRGQAGTAREPFYLSGLLTCASCDSPVVGGGGSRKGTRSEATRFYRCRGGNGFRPRCSSPALTVGKVWLEGEVVAQVVQHVAGLVKTGALARALDALYGTERQDRRSRQALDKQLRKIAAERESLVDTLGRMRGKAKLAVEAKLSALDAQEQAVEREGSTLLLAKDTAARRAERDRVLRLAADLPRLLRGATPERARELLGCWLAGGTLDKVARMARLDLRQAPLASIPASPSSSALRSAYRSARWCGARRAARRR